MQKRFKFYSPATCHLPIVRPLVDNSKVLYSLYENRNGRWDRISEASYTSQQVALQVFSSRLLLSPLTIQIRPIDVKLNGVNLRFNR